MNEYNYNGIATDIMSSNYKNNLADYISNMSNNMTYNIPNIDSYPNTMPNYMPNINSNDNKILEPYSGFVRGNMFDNLYDPYKNYKPRDIDPTNEREAMLEQWQQYNFALVDLGLYLDVYPNDTNALNLYRKYLDINKQITKKYESMYGPLELNSEYAATNKWNWDNSPWPWEVIK